MNEWFDNCMQANSSKRGRERERAGNSNRPANNKIDLNAPGFATEKLRASNFTEITVDLTNSHYLNSTRSRYARTNLNEFEQIFSAAMVKKVLYS
jgi:hypothetical protein